MMTHLNQSTESTKQRTYSYIAGITNPNSFTTEKRTSLFKLPESSFLKKVETSPDDEVLLTELGFDSKTTITYEVNAVILVAEKEQSNPHGKFRCYMNGLTREFFIEIPDEGTMAAFNRSALLNVMDLAEKAGVEVIYICVSNTVRQQDAFLQNFLFLGFARLNTEDQKTISMSKTHSILKCSLRSDPDDYDD